LAALAPVATDGMRPCTPLKPCEPLAKYAVVVFEEQPMPDSFTSCSAACSAQMASMIADVTESWPQPAHTWTSRLRSRGA